MSNTAYIFDEADIPPLCDFWLRRCERVNRAGDSRGTVTNTERMQLRMPSIDSPQDTIDSSTKIPCPQVK